MIGNHTGLTIYSGLDADAINDRQLNPNDEITELALQLEAPFRTTPDTACAPNCTRRRGDGGAALPHLQLRSPSRPTGCTATSRSC